MPSTTTHYSLRKPNGSDSANGVLAIGETADDVDVALYTHATAGTLDHPDGSVTTAKLADQGVSNAKMGTDTARRNLLTNGGFEIWQRGAGAFSTANTYAMDRWQLAINGTSVMSVSQDVVHNDAGSQSCAAVAYTHNTLSTVIQRIEDYLQLRGQSISFSMRVRANAANAVRLAISTDNGATVAATSTYHSGGGAYETLTVSVAVPSNATGVLVSVQFAATVTAYLDNAMLVLGGVPAAYQPGHLADELARCQRYRQQWNATAGGQMIGSGQCYDTVHAILILPTTVTMGGMPTLTTSAVTDWEITGATANGIQLATLALSSYLGHAARLDAGVAAGLVAGNATLLGSWSGSPNAWLALEWNP